jgi:hypothetical protein
MASIPPDDRSRSRPNVGEIAGTSGHPRGAWERIRMVCTRCSFAFRLDVDRLPVTPVHPVVHDSGTVTWTMCPGSGKQGLAIVSSHAGKAVGI